jgi:tRNA (guanine-N7-)-methyltransferase
MAGEDVPESAHVAVTEEKTGVEERNGVDEKNEGAVTGEEETKKPFIKGKRKNEQEAQVKAGKQKGQLPKKRFYRARAHSNPLSDCQFSV